VDITGKVVDTDSGSSSEGENIAAKPTKDGSLTSRGQIGLAEPRTSQGVFGPNGESDTVEIVTFLLTYLFTSQGKWSSFHT